MSLYASFHHILADLVASHRAAATERLLGALPADVRKDIGWPAPNGRRHHVAVDHRLAVHS
jgi:hypothetical protein